MESIVNCCPMCVGMEDYYLPRVSYDFDEEMTNCEVMDDDND